MSPSAQLHPAANRKGHRVLAPRLSETNGKWRTWDMGQGLLLTLTLAPAMPVNIPCKHLLSSVDV